MHMKYFLNKILKKAISGVYFRFEFPTFCDHLWYTDRIL